MPVSRFHLSKHLNSFHEGEISGSHGGEYKDDIPLGYRDT
jgi:hypothetical protein